MSDFENFKCEISQIDWSKFKEPITKENENSEAMPWVLKSSANVTCEILNQYTKWLIENYNITPKD